jgi:hypothetical protein
MRCCLFLGTFFLLALPPLASAQSFPPDRFFWELTPQVGVFVPEEPEASEIEAGALFGARAGYRRTAGVGVELRAAYSPLELELEGDPDVIDLAAFLYDAEASYSWPLGVRTDLFIAAGFGGITWDLDLGEEGEGSETNPRVTLGGGAHVLLNRWIALRGDVRDHIIFDQLSDTARSLRLVDKGNTNNFEVSLGASFILP